MHRMVKHSRLWRIAAAVAIWFGAPCDASTLSVASEKRPNIVFILADDLGWADLHCQGSRYYETPNIDRLAAQGMRFTDGYSCGPNCQPTRAALMTGQYGPRTGIYTVGPTSRFNTSMRPVIPVANVLELAPEKITIAAMLKSAGYATGMFGKWHLGEDPRHHPAARGFDEAIVSMGRHFDFQTNPPVAVPKGTYLADFLTDQAVDFIERHKDGPFFLYLPHFGVHAPYEAKPDKIAAFRKRPPAGGQHDPTYASMIASVDESVGRVLAKLDGLGLAGQTLVIFSSDNGGVGGYRAAGVNTRDGITDNAPLRGGKGMLYEGGVRVPFIFRWPGRIRAGAVCDEPIISVDLASTLLELAQAKPPENQPLDGCSLLPVLLGRAPRLERDALYWHFPGYLGSGPNVWRTTPAGAIRVRDYKLIEFFEDGRLELYNLRVDVGQKRNLEKERPDLVQNLHARLQAWRQTVGAPMPRRRTDQERPAASSTQPERPNVVVILADDLGYGDLGCYGAKQVKTPNIDRLARAGRLFIDAHSPSSVCTPSRYALLTGQYAWRHRPASGILEGNAPLCIPVERLTLARLFQQAGYATGAVGKWHLGLGKKEPDFNQEIRPGPLEIGFGYFFGFAATGDRTPCVFIENHRVVGAETTDPIRVSYKTPLREDPIGREHPELLRVKPSHGHSDTIINGISRIGYMSGGHKARWRDEDMADILTHKAVDFIEKSRQRPFFLYFATHDIHVPRVPNPRFAGRSAHGTRGDVIQEFDWSVGEVLAALDRLKLADNTLVIVTSDNGGVMDDGYQDGSGHDTSGHRCNGRLRGYKGGLFEGGHRVPFVARWKGHIPAGVSNQLICHVDLLATCADLLGRPLEPEAALDSVDVLPALLGTTEGGVRHDLVHHTGGFPGRLAIRSGNWKLIPAARPSESGRPRGGPLLFNLAEDPQEARDLSAERPEKVRELETLLQKVRDVQRSPTVK